MGKNLLKVLFVIGFIILMISTSGSAEGWVIRGILFAVGLVVFIAASRAEKKEIMRISEGKGKGIIAELYKAEKRKNIMLVLKGIGVFFLLMLMLVGIFSICFNFDVDLRVGGLCALFTIILYIVIQLGLRKQGKIIAARIELLKQGIIPDEECPKSKAEDENNDWCSKE